MVVQNRMQETGEIVPSAAFTPVFSKRSRETKAKEHPLSEQEEMEKQLIVEEAHGPVTDSAIAGNAIVGSDIDYENDICRLTEMEVKPAASLEFYGCEMEVYDILSSEPTHMDTLCQKLRMPVSEISAALTMLELAGMAVRLAGDRYVRYITESAELKTVRANITISAEVADTVDAAISFIRDKFHGVSRKYLQNYLAAYWLELAKTKRQRSLLLEWCWHFGPICYEQILAYISPLQVKLPPNA